MALLSPSPASSTPHPEVSGTAPGGPEFGASPAVDPLAALRAATADTHARLDSQLPLSRDAAGIVDYAWHVATIGAWLADIDRLPIAADGWPAGWQQRQQARRARVAADLEALPDSDLSPMQPEPAELPSTVLPEGFAWGVAYVVEGSQLGGHLLYRRLQERLAPHPLHYLRGDDRSGPSPWPRFTAALRAAMTTPAQVQATTDGAQWAFASLSERFTRAGVLA